MTDDCCVLGQTPGVIPGSMPGRICGLILGLTGPSLTPGPTASGAQGRPRGGHVGQGPGGGGVRGAPEGRVCVSAGWRCGKTGKQGRTAKGGKREGVVVGMEGAQQGEANDGGGTGVREGGGRGDEGGVVKMGPERGRRNGARRTWCVCVSERGAWVSGGRRGCACLTVFFHLPIRAPAALTGIGLVSTNIT